MDVEYQIRKSFQTEVQTHNEHFCLVRKGSLICKIQSAYRQQSSGIVLIHCIIINALSRKRFDKFFNPNNTEKGCGLHKTKMTDKNDYQFHIDESAVSGYLYKKTRDGRWQKRWFETNGVYLTYYKSKKMEKLLAALSLPQVGEIKIIPPEQDPERLEGLFTIELNTRIYTLRAKSASEAQSWVTMLTKLRQEGIKAASTPQSPMAASATINVVDHGRSSDASKTEWIKSGKSCLGCC